MSIVSRYQTVCYRFYVPLQITVFRRAVLFDVEIVGSIFGPEIGISDRFSSLTARHGVVAR